MVSHYNKTEVKPLIIQLLEKEGLKIIEDNIKIWSTDTMRSIDVKGACDYIKSTGASPVLVYTNKVPFKSFISQKEAVKIYDKEDLEILAIRHDSKLLKYL